MIESKKTASRSAAKKAATVLAAFAALSVCAFAQESYSGVYPEISTEMTFSSGIKNIDENATVDEIPGLSSEYTADIGIQIKGSFSRASEWGVEKEDGIQWKSGVGYEAGFTVDMSKVYEAVNASDSSSSSSSSSSVSSWVFLFLLSFFLQLFYFLLCSFSCFCVINCFSSFRILCCCL